MVALSASSQESRAEQLKKLQQLKKTHVRLLDELGAYGACDPAKVEEMRRAVTLGKGDNYIVCCLLIFFGYRQRGGDPLDRCVISRRLFATEK
jgi:hypothetical protein